VRDTFIGENATCMMEQGEHTQSSTMTYKRVRDTFIGENATCMMEQGEHTQSSTMTLHLITMLTRSFLGPGARK
jgi:hypothetical protein